MTTYSSCLDFMDAANYPFFSEGMNEWNKSQGFFKALNHKIENLYFTTGNQTKLQVHTLKNTCKHEYTCSFRNLSKLNYWLTRNGERCRQAATKLDIFFCLLIHPVIYSRVSFSQIFNTTVRMEKRIYNVCLFTKYYTPVS